MATEFAGHGSLSCPAVVWLNLAVLGTGCGFPAAAVAGYAFYRGRSEYWPHISAGQNRRAAVGQSPMAYLS